MWIAQQKLAADAAREKERLAEYQAEAAVHDTKGCVWSPFVGLLLIFWGHWQIGFLQREPEQGSRFFLLASFTTDKVRFLGSSRVHFTLIRTRDTRPHPRAHLARYALMGKAESDIAVKRHAVNFMYDAPPGFEKKKEDNDGKLELDPKVTPPPPPHYHHHQPPPHHYHHQ